MISSASLLFLAQLATPTFPAVPVALVARVEEAIGAQWGIAPSSIELDWGTLPALRAEDLTAPMRIGPISREGWFAVTVDPPTLAPRAFRARAGTKVPQPIATRVLSGGTVLGAEDIEWALRTRWGPPDTSRAAVEVGWEVRRGVNAGDLLVGVVVAPPRAVSPGEALRVFWSKGGVEIELEAVALTGGRVGDTVQARTSTGRVSARMTGVGTAHIEGGNP